MCWSHVIRRFLSMLGLAVAFFARPAHADLRDVAARVIEEWRRAGAEVGRAPARFLYEDETATITVPAAPPGVCTTVAVGGARGLSFHAKVSGADDDPLSLDETARAS